MSGSSSRALVFGFRMCCVVAEPRLVASPDSCLNDISLTLLLTTHPVWGWACDLKIKCLGPYKWAWQATQAEVLPTFSCTLPDQIHTFKIPVSLYSFTRFMEAGQNSVSSSSAATCFLLKCKSLFIDHEIPFIECSKEHGCELDLWPCSGPIRGEILIT